MNEKKRSRREWVKTAAIIFLSVMLVLTFFSNTIMNYSLAEVATQYVQSGTITERVTGTGIVESGSLYNVKISESRKVASVEVRSGDKVEIGDVICYLAQQESTELEQARKELENAQRQYDQALLSGDLDSAVMQNGGMTQTVSGYRNQLLAAKALVDDLEAQLHALELLYYEAKAEKDSADLALKEAQDTVENLTFWLRHQVEDLGGENTEAIDDLTAQLNNAKELAQVAQSAVASAELKLSQVETDKENVNLMLQDAKSDLADLTADISGALALSALSDAVQEAQEKVERLEKESAGAAVTADVAGTIVSVSVVAGEDTDPNIPVATIQPDGKGYSLSFTVTVEQAKKISVGDPAELVNSWWYSNVTATVASIRPDPKDPARNKLVTFSLSGDVTEGQSLSLQVGQKSSRYDYIVPNSAIKEDNNGKFILVVESRPSPLGTRYYAVRYDVEVLAADDTQSAISAGLEGYEYVITTANKPVSAGDMVRLQD